MPCLTILILVTALLHSSSVHAAPWTRRRCFDDPPIGCFTTKPPYNNTPYLPHSPISMNIHYAHTIHGDSATFHWRDASAVMKTRFRPELKTVVIVHGFLEYGTKPWVLRLAAEFASLDEPINIVVVDWRRGARVLTYARCVANGRVIAAMGALLLNEFIALGANASSFHIIGNSLGAHIAGDMAARINGTGRVTGMDPSRRHMLGYSHEVALDPTDAIVVDVLHTDGDERYGYGTVIPMGTVDFYANGGLTQPGCSESWWGIVLDLFWVNHEKCSHHRAINLYTESVARCRIQAGLCLELDDITQKRCTGCVLGKPCATVGYRVDPTKTGMYAFETGDSSPFC